jgi:hypothetical protein
MNQQLKFLVAVVVICLALGVMLYVVLAKTDERRDRPDCEKMDEFFSEECAP